MKKQESWRPNKLVLFIEEVQFNRIVGLLNFIVLASDECIVRAKAKAKVTCLKKGLK